MRSAKFLVPYSGRHLVAPYCRHSCTLDLSLSAASATDATPQDIDAVMRRAELAAPCFARAPATDVAKLLEAAASEIEELGEELVDVAVAETKLLDTRIRGEAVRTTGQLRAFAELVREGSWVDARLDVGKGAGRDIRRMLRPLGPAVIFGASNFPLAFSVAGGDTAAALAARCPVVHKAHPAHPRTCNLVASALHRAVASVSSIPEDAFALVHGESTSVGKALVQHPAARVGGFTGSLAAGRALYDLAAQRPRPIPFYAEMGSVNPVVLLPGALGSKWESIAGGLAGSVTLGAGQFCTNPGLILVTSPADTTLLSKFLKELARTVDRIAPSEMLTSNIASAYQSGISALTSVEGVQLLTAEGREPGGGAVLTVPGKIFLEHEATLQEEVFGPCTLVVDCADISELHNCVAALEGQLTSTVWGSERDLVDAETSGLLDMLADKSGRVLFNGFPTGVEVCSAMTHSGPYPASTIDETSVGTGAIRRFTRPVSWQDAPDSLLPIELRDANPRNIMRIVNNVLQRGPVNEYNPKQVV